MHSILEWCHTWIWGGEWAMKRPGFPATQHKCGFWTHCKAMLIVDLIGGHITVTAIHNGMHAKKGKAWTYGLRNY